MRREIRISGSGGQGIIMAGYLLGKAATIYDGKIATQVQSYGPEARGGASRAEVIISDDDVYYPYIQMADVFISLSQLGYEKYRRDVKKDSMTFIDPVFVSPVNNNCLKIPATTEAIELGSKIVTNMVMLGAVAEITKVVTIEALEKSIRSSLQERLQKINIDALRRGREIGIEMMESQKLEMGD